MSGHSKWATIHRKKGLIDAQRGKIFQKLAKEIMVATKGGSPDPNENASLRLAVDKAKAANMPKENIEFMVDCLTDNRNRTAPMVRNCFTKSGGNLGTDGSVSYMFNRKGSIIIQDAYEEDKMLEVSLDAGAEDFEHVEDTFVISTDQESFTKVRDALENAGVKEFLECSLTYVPTMEVEITDEETKERVYKLIENLEDLDDVQDVYYNLKEE